jgi:hypothetical protein
MTMRTTLLIAALSLSAFTPSDAEACGSYNPEPRVMRLSTHFLTGFDNSGPRSFVLFGASEPTAKLAWRKLAPGTYDMTEIANDMLLANPVTLTLLGPSGTRVVSSSKHVFLSRSWNIKTTTSALDVGNVEGFTIAIEGAHANATWIALEDTSYKKAKGRAWVTALGVSPYHAGSIWVSRLKGTNVEAVSVYGKDGKTITFLKHGDKNLGRFAGSPIGAFTNAGVIKVVLADDAFVTTAFVGV